jgi:ethanolaminephosphotransferase
MQSRTTNIPVFLINEVLYRIFLQQRSLALELKIPLLTLLMQHFTFHSMGNTNSLASVDLSNAYNGIEGYKIEIVSILTFIGNWAGPVWWSIAGISTIRDREGLSGLFAYSVVTATHRSAMMLSIMLACFVLRSHLFVWTVFSPKFLYCVVWMLFQQIVIDIVFCGIIGRFGNANRQKIIN